MTCDRNRLKVLCGKDFEMLEGSAVVAYGHFALCSDPNGVSLGISKQPLTGSNDSAPNGSGSVEKGGGDETANASSHNHEVIQVRGKGAVHATDQGAEHPPIFTIGKSYLETDVDALTKTFEDHSKPLYKSRTQTSWTPDHATVSLTLTESQTENDLVSMEAAGRQKSTSAFSRKSLHISSDEF